MEWIDAHVHIGDDAEGIAASEQDVHDLLQDDIDRAVVFCMDEQDGIPAGNDRVRRAVADHDRLAGLLRVDPAVHDPGAVDDADWAAGIKLHPRSQAFSMQQVFRHIRAAVEEDLPVLVHTGVGDGPVPRGHPEEVLDAAAAHPDATIILAHMTKGYYFHAPAFQDRCQRLDKAYIDTTLHCTPLGVETVVGDLGADRVLFASDYPYGHPDPMRRNVALADIGDDARRQVAAGNAARLFF